MTGIKTKTPRPNPSRKTDAPRTKDKPPASGAKAAAATSKQPMTPERVKQARAIAEGVRDDLSSSNRVGGAIKDVAVRGLLALWDVFSLGTTRLRNDGITDQSMVGILGTRKRTVREGVGALPGVPQDKLTPSDRKKVQRQLAHIARRMGEIAVEEGWGNCQECAALTATRLHDAGFRDVELAKKLGKDGAGEHVFVIVGRKARSDINDPSAWGPDALIVDGWGGDGLAVRPKNIKQIPGIGAMQSIGLIPDPPPAKKTKPATLKLGLVDPHRCIRGSFEQDRFVPSTSPLSQALPQPALGDADRAAITRWLEAGTPGK